MDNMQTLHRSIGRAGWGLLAILWGVVMLFDFLPFEAGLIGTGFILLGIARWTNQLSLNNDTTVLGILIVEWAGLEFARPVLRELLPSAGLDWVVFAVLLISLGGILLGREMVRPGSSDESGR